MIQELLTDATAMWREITKLARPVDSEKQVITKPNPKSPNDFDAYTDDKKIYISINNEAKFRKNFEDIIVPAYRIAASKLYDVAKKISDTELLKNLVLDTLLFIHFHEQFHPWLCPNSREDEKRINIALFEGIRKALPSLPKKEAFFKVNNCKNLIWDTVLNVSFISKTSGNDTLEEKISYVFTKEGRKIEYQPVTHYPSGILPIIYMSSARNRTTEIPISLMGLFYSTLSYNDSDVRKNAVSVFLDDLKSKGMQNSDALDTLKKMYLGFVAELDETELNARDIDKKEYLKRINLVDVFDSHGYEENQKYFSETLTKIFDTSMRYKSLKGIAKVLAPFITNDKKSGSPDPNTSGSGSGDGSSDDDSDGSGSDKSQDELDEGSMVSTLDDLLDGLDEKDKNDILNELANDPELAPGGSSAGKPMPSHKIRKKLSIISADEYYKLHADTLEIRNPSQENFSIDLGDKKVWKLVNSATITSAQASQLNHQQIINFQKRTGLPVLMELGSGFYKLNNYRIKSTPLKSYNAQLTGVEIPENWVVFQDSSGSMAGIPYVGTKCRFDLLNMVKYGVMKGLYEVGKKLGKDVHFGVVDFSDRTIYSGMESLIKVYDARTHPIKEVSLTPQCGGTSCSSAVFKKVRADLKPGRTVITFISDGEIAGDTASLYREIENFVSEPEHALLFVEIQSNSSFGMSMASLSKKNPALVYRSVHDVSAIKKEMGQILIQYK